ncbi:MAG: glycosyltransferase family A protein [Rothia sp. (in: high G+C Gram-positive bacteria)]|uniref:glycosyltransferase family 2 protein n=1 Tax=Rothia sp. (in: high G+C Gram-positive bacteria) TaxID=1885016 RepID=UPI0026DFE8D1|nr:glycosyltransferase family A protein [Rothia sp. (in: high G+C Gram-positive bacteria)]MDO5749643.1 glycosyltransferase family A protein [Rothia sp. (in: high G+C Gram-positive bacteria)]
MPVYNTADTVIEAIRSVQAQTDPDFELLIIIDASPDNSQQVIEEYLHANPDPRVKVYAETINRGSSEVRNYAMDLIRGRWFAFLDSDDFYRSDYLEKMHAAVERYPQVQVVAAGHSMLYPDGSERDRSPQNEKYYGDNEQILVDYLNDQITPFTWDKIYRTDVCRGYHYPQNVQRGDDGVGSLSLLTNVSQMAIIRESLYVYRVNASGLTWGSLPPVTNTEDHIGHLERILGDRLHNPRIASAFNVARAMVILLNAQQALLIGGTQAQAIVRRCRQMLEWKQIIGALQSNRMVGAAAALLKMSPAAYKAFYSAYARKQYGL